MKFAFRYRLYAGTAFVFILSALIGITSYWTLKKQIGHSSLVKHSYMVINMLQNVENQLLNMETGRRGFRATNERRFLEPYYLGIQNIDIATIKLQKLVSDNPEQVRRVAQLEVHISNLINFWRDKGDDVSKYTRDAMTQISVDEKNLMDGIRAEIVEIQQAENKLLVEREKDNNDSISYAMVSAAVGTTLVQVIILLLLFVIMRELANRNKAKEQIRQSNIKLIRQTDLLQQSQEELKTALSDVENINKQLEQFVYTVAHDIKTPLAGIIGISEQMKKKEQIYDDPQLREYVDLSANAANHLNNMVESLLASSKKSINQQQKEEVDVKEMVTQIVLLMFLPGNIFVRVDTQMPVFKTTKFKIEQVFYNLISNAVKYNDKEEGQIEVGCGDNGRFYRFSVKDNGQGIADDQKENVYKIFQTTNNIPNRETSTGLGLNIVKTIVEEQGGKIWFDSVPGEGTVFYFEWKK